MIEVSLLSFSGVSTSGTTSSSDLEAAFASLAANGQRGLVPEGVITLDATVNMPPGLRLRGAGASGYKTRYEPTQQLANLRGEGSWFHFDHSGIGFSCSGYTSASSQFGEGVQLEAFGTYRSQPDPSDDWTPTDYGFDFVLSNVGVTLRDLVLWNPTRGINVTDGTGRLLMDNIRGQAFDAFLQVDNCDDTLFLNDIEQWPFFCDDPRVHAYTMNNLTTFSFGRVDHISADGLFSIYANYGILLNEKVTKNAMFSNCMIDSIGRAGLVIAGGDGSRVQYSNGVFCGRSDTTAALVDGVWITDSAAAEPDPAHCPTRAVIQLSDVTWWKMNRCAVKIEAGTGHQIAVSTPSVEFWGLDGGQPAAFSAYSGSRIDIDGRIARTIDTTTYPSSSTILVSDDGGLVTSLEPRSETTPVSATAGVIGSATAYLRYWRHGDDVRVEGRISVTSNGTGDGALVMGAPYDAAFIPSPAPYGSYNGCGRNHWSGQQLMAWVDGGSIVIQNDDGSYPGATGGTYDFTIEYEAV